MDFDWPRDQGMDQGMDLGEDLGEGQEEGQSADYDQSMAYPQPPQNEDTQYQFEGDENENEDAMEEGEGVDAVDTVSIPAAPENENEEGTESESVSMGYPADGEYGQYYAGYPADEGMEGESESMMGLPPQHRPKSPADKRRGERREESSLFDAATVFNLDTDLSSRDIF